MTPEQRKELVARMHRARDIAAANRLISGDKPQRRLASKPIPEHLVAISQERQKAILEFVERKAPSRLSLFKKVYAGETPLSKAVKAKCLECANLSIVEIAECSVYSCPLWRFRPFQEGQDEQDEPCQTLEP